MRHWEKNKKDLRKNDDRDFSSHNTQDHKKKKLKPADKVKYRLKASHEDEYDD
ncbi:MAG: hypothetical protein IT269_14290 [Saprospiraceae bacterium]|nr:hypothetical protein [Saprospiraceae bacterium]